jgi:hypothetical protein
MAISYLNYSLITDSDGTFSQSVTVPANTSHALIFIGGWNTSGNGVSSISLGGTSATLVIARAESSAEQDMLAYIVATSEGSKTFSASMTNAFTEGGISVLVYLSGVDATTPIVDSDYHKTELTAVSSVTRTLDTIADGIGVVFATCYQNTNLAVTEQSQTQIVNAGPYNSDYYAAAYKTTAGITATFGINSSGDSNYHSSLYVTLRPSAGESAKSLPPNIIYSARFAPLLVR